MQQIIIKSDERKIFFYFDRKLSKQEVENVNKVLAALLPEKNGKKVFVFTKASQNFISIYGGEYSLNDYYYFNSFLRY